MSLSNSASPSAKSPSPTYNGYARFTKFAVPKLSDSSFVKPPHMQSPEYLLHHASKPATSNKFIALNDLEEGVKFSILSDIERDQRLQAIKEKIEQDNTRAIQKQGEIERKRKADHDSFNRYVKKAEEEKSDLQIKYNELFDRFTNLQRAHLKLENEHRDCDIKVKGCAFENNRLKTVITMKDQEITDLNETLKLYAPQSPPNLNAFADIMNEPNLDLKQSADYNDFHDFTFSENPFIDLNQDEEPVSAFPGDKLAQTQPATYTKKSDDCCE